MEENKNEQASNEAGHPEPASSAPVSEIDRARALVTQYGVPMAAALIAALLVVGGYAWYRMRSQSNEATAAQMLQTATTPRQLEDLVAHYGATATAPNAMLALAKAYYDSGSYDMAQKEYVAFEKKYPKHPLVDTAEFGKIKCLEATGQSEDALTAYDKFVAARPDSFLVNSAKLSQARLLEQAGRLQEAKIKYEDFVANNPKNPRLQEVEEALSAINLKLSSGAAPTNKATAPTINGLMPK